MNSSYVTSPTLPLLPVLSVNAIVPSLDWTVRQSLSKEEEEEEELRWVMNFRIGKRVSHVCVCLQKQMINYYIYIILFKSVLHRGNNAEYSSWKRRGVM